MCVIAPFCAIELPKSTTTRIQKTRDCSPSRSDAPPTRVATARVGDRPLTDEPRDGRQPDREHHRAEDQAGTPPSRARDERLGDRRQHHRADGAAAT